MKYNKSRLNTSEKPKNAELQNKMGPEKYFAMSNPDTIKDESFSDSFSEESNENPYTMFDTMYPDEDEENIDQHSIGNIGIKSRQLNSDPQQNYNIKITMADLELMVTGAVKDKNGNKPFLYLTGGFMSVFERQMDKIEGFKVGIQKRNNILYVDRSRSSTAYIRVNGDCKYCPKNAKVRYVFTVKDKPIGTEKFIDVDTKCRGEHQHSGANVPKVCDISSSCSSYNEQLPLKDKLVQNTTTRISPKANKRSCSESPRLSVASKIVSLAKRRRKLNSDSVRDGVGLSEMERALVSEISKQVSDRIMNKLEQIEEKVDLVSSRVAEVEKKFECLERLVDEQLL